MSKRGHRMLRQRIAQIEAVPLLGSLLKKLWKARVRKGKAAPKILPYTGTVFDRLEGLEYILERCANCSILDFGSSDGLVSYEFARHGATLIHGFDIWEEGVAFSKRLFDNVPVAAEFVQADLAISGKSFQNKHGDLLKARYDIVLYLGMHHALKTQMPKEELNDLVAYLAGKAARWVVVRTNTLPEFEQVILGSGLRVVYVKQGRPKVGLLKVFERA